jgi:CheY-like chemotaxis protein
LIVLLIELVFAVAIVEPAGFEAIHASDVDEAVSFLGSRPDIALLLTAISLPENMDGLKRVHAVRRRWTLIKIIIASGHTRLAGCGLPANAVFHQSLSFGQDDRRNAFAAWRLNCNY